MKNSKSTARADTVSSNLNAERDIKNPAYGKQRISGPMQIVEPIQFWQSCIILFGFVRRLPNYIFNESVFLCVCFFRDFYRGYVICPQFL